MPTENPDRRVDAARTVAGALDVILGLADEQFVRWSLARLPRREVEEACALSLKLLASALVWADDAGRERVLDGIRQLGRPDDGWSDYDDPGPGDG